MAFWSGQELARRVASENLISNFDVSNIDCASYTLHVGSQMFITQEGSAFQRMLDRGHLPGLINLKPDVIYNIPPGQFAFLLTDEIVRMPPDALGFISIKARHKYKGLVNVSGFHVDPGWNGHLMFSVFNAGPAPIPLKKAASPFLLWFASLDQPSDDRYTYESAPASKKPEIQVKYVEGLITAPVRSLPSLSRDVQKLKHAALRGDIAFGIVLAVALVLIGLEVKSLIPSRDLKFQTSSNVNVTHSRPQAPPLQQRIDIWGSTAPNAASRTSSKVKPEEAVSARSNDKHSGTR